MQYHLIFVCKYRKKLLTREISDDIKQLSYEICSKHNVTIREMETDLDHIHYFIETEPIKTRSLIWCILLLNNLQCIDRQLAVAKLFVSLSHRQHIIFGKDMANIFQNIYGITTRFGLTDILYVLKEM